MCVSTYRQLLSAVTGDESMKLGYADYVLDILAKAMQQPTMDRGKNVILVIYGEKGTGKGLCFVDILQWAFGMDREDALCCAVVFPQH